jgi:hypothetical protein
MAAIAVREDQQKLLEIVHVEEKPSKRKFTEIQSFQIPTNDDSDAAG